MEPADRIDTVIEDPALRRLAHSGSEDSAAPVLIEVEVPTDVDTVGLPVRGGPSHGRPDAVTVEISTGQPEAATTRAVSSVIGQNPRYLRAAGAFAAVVTGAQLAALAATPVVRAIRPDRLLQIRGDSVSV